jgi:SAM-dependent methyltransferase
MKYFKNTDLAKLHHVSEKSVRNWIDAAEQEKLALHLYERNGKHYVANTPHNTLIIKQLVERGKKYKNSRGHKTISPREKFYDAYSTKQIFDIISNLTVHREIPLQYSYVDGGAEYWDKYAERLTGEKAPNILTSTMDLLSANTESLDRLLGTDRQVNIVDLGPGNGLPVKNLLEHLLKNNRLKRYIAIDISQEMLDITKKHVHQWFGDSVAFEGYVRDFSTERFDDLFAEDHTNDESEAPINLVLLLSGTLCNFRSPNQALQAINNSLGLDDLLVYTTKLDTANSRRYFDLGIESSPRPLDFLFKIVVDLLAFEESFYEVDQFFDIKRQARVVKIRPTVDLSIEFKFKSGGTRKVNLRKNEPILLWRYWHQNALDVINQFDRNEFDLQQVTKSNDQEYLLLISKIKISSGDDGESIGDIG